MIKKNILITGCAGFIGSSVARELIKKKNKVWGIDNLSRGKRNNIPKNLKFIKGNCEDDLVLGKLKKKKFYAILHFAGQSSGEISFQKPLEDFNSNLHSTLKLLNFSIINKCNHFIYASSMSVYGDQEFITNEKIPASPKSFYGISKASSENYIKLFKSKGLNYTILRFFNVYGPGQKLDSLKQGMIRIYFNQIIKNKKLVIKGDKNRTRDFIYIDDVVNIVCKLIGRREAYNNTFNICTGKSFKVNDLITKIRKVVKFNFKIIYKKSTPFDQKKISASNKKIKELLKIKKFVDLDEGLRNFYLDLSKKII